ncbi:hypothetical protein J2S41_002177 [Catenuloplanes atrovinosus]|uniref:Uncharacterized protein n=1 Tax=Catenuloplanes atrovinosus TaxID=137266 RepID=A0AAE4CA23_9ACTN|nr:hypothetical protein [Catenuloplanes atrovinosus]
MCAIARAGVTEFVAAPFGDGERRRRALDLPGARAH